MNVKGIGTEKKTLRADIKANQEVIHGEELEGLWTLSIDCEEVWHFVQHRAPNGSL